MCLWGSHSQWDRSGLAMKGWRVSACRRRLWAMIQQHAQRLNAPWIDRLDIQTSEFDRLGFDSSDGTCLLFLLAGWTDRSISYGSQGSRRISSSVDQSVGRAGGSLLNFKRESNKASFARDGTISTHGFRFVSSQAADIATSKAGLRRPLQELGLNFGGWFGRSQNLRVSKPVCASLAHRTHTHVQDFLWPCAQLGRCSDSDSVWWLVNPSNQ